MINTHNGVREKDIPPVDVTKYPAIKNHLDKFYDRLLKRQDQGNTPYNLRSCAYMDDFSKRKIIYPDIMRMPNQLDLIDTYPYFYYDTDNFYIEATNFMITGVNIDLLYLFLASNVGFYAFTKFYSGPQFDSTGFRYKKAYLEMMPIPEFSMEIASKLRKLVIELSKSASNKESIKLQQLSFKINEILERYICLDTQEKVAISEYKKSLLY